MLLRSYFLGSLYLRSLVQRLLLTMGGRYLRMPQILENYNFADVDFVHITHEHPDHTNIATLKHLNSVWNPTFLVPYTNDKRMINFIKSVLKKPVIEMQPSTCLELDKNFTITSYPHGHLDSYSLLSVYSNILLNINDCVFNTRGSLERLRKNLGSCSIDLLLSQYSFATSFPPYCSDSLSSLRPKLIQDLFLDAKF